MKDLEKKTKGSKFFFANCVLMIRPANFGFNEQTAGSNFFQVNAIEDNINDQAVNEFDAFANKLIDAGIKVLVFNDDASVILPDAIFPNNWFSTFQNKLYLYPMLAENRRNERRKDIVEKLKKDFDYQTIVDLSGYENQNLYLEGTGSMIFNHRTKKIYASLSPRTHETLVKKVADELKYEAVLFTSSDENRNTIYHTNVMLTIANGFAVICLESIAAEEEKRNVIKNLNADGLEIFEITFEQMKNFCGNMLQLVNDKGEDILVMSERAKSFYSPLMLAMIQRHTKVLAADLNVIETVGGGGARCMLGEVF